MKIALFGFTEIKLGKHNLKDPRLDQADKLVEADKKTYAQADVIGEDQLLDADGILATQDTKADLILKDLEFVETRLGRDPQPAEQAALKKIQGVAGERAVPLQLGAERGGPAGGGGAQLLHQQTDHGGGAEPSCRTRTRCCCGRLRARATSPS